MSFGRDALFWPLLTASTVNFAGLFLYIASAPRIVRELLQLSAQGFPWLFVPVVAGMVTGAWCSGRLAERASVRVTVNLGYVSMGLACALHLALAIALLQPRLPWSMLPLILHGIGVQLAFPTLTLLLLDRFPQRRGGISSVQAFASLLLCSVVAGLFSPLLSTSMLGLALGASALTAAAHVGAGSACGRSRRADPGGNCRAALTDRGATPAVPSRRPPTSAPSRWPARGPGWASGSPDRPASGATPTRPLFH